MKKYGGVNNQKTLYEIQEARIVGTPQSTRTSEKHKKSIGIFGWVLYFIVSYLFTNLIIVIATGDYIINKIPTWAIPILFSGPFLLTVLFKIVTTIYNKKHTNHED